MLKENFVSKPGKIHIGIYSKSINFNPLDYDDSNSAARIGSLMDDNFKRDIRLITDTIVKILS